MSYGWTTSFWLAVRPDGSTSQPPSFTALPDGVDGTDAFYRQPGCGGWALPTRKLPPVLPSALHPGMQRHLRPAMQCRMDARLHQPMVTTIYAAMDADVMSAVVSEPHFLLQRDVADGVASALPQTVPLGVTRGVTPRRTARTGFRRAF